MWNTIKAKYHAMSLPMRASVLFMICGLMQKGIAFLVVPVFTRLMPAEEYGQYSVFLSWYQIIMIFATLNMWNYLINNGMTKYGDDRSNFIASLQGLSTAITIALFLIYIPLSSSWEKASGLSFPVMALMFIELLFMPSFEYYCAVKRYDYKAEKVVLMTLFMTLLIPLISIPLILVSDDKGFAAIFGRVSASIVVYGIVFVHLLRCNRSLYHKEYWRYALKFNLPLIPHFLSLVVLQQSDRIMIERMCGGADAAIYSVAYQAATALQILNMAILNSFVPYTYKAIQNNEKEKVGKAALRLLICVGGLNAFAVLFAPEIIYILAPEEYFDAVYVIPPVAMSNMFMFLFNLFANIEYYWGETRYVAIASLVSAVANIVLNYFMIKQYGFIAAGFTTLFCYVLLSICHYFFMKKVCRQYMDGGAVYNAKKIAAISVIFTAGALLVIAVYDIGLLRYMVAGICIAGAGIQKKRGKLCGISK